MVKIILDNRNGIDYVIGNEGGVAPTDRKESNAESQEDKKVALSPLQTFLEVKAALPGVLELRKWTNRGAMMPEELEYLCNECQHEWNTHCIMIQCPECDSWDIEEQACHSTRK